MEVLFETGRTENRSTRSTSSGTAPSFRRIKNYSFIQTAFVKNMMDTNGRKTPATLTPFWDILIWSKPIVIWMSTSFSHLFEIFCAPTAWIQESSGYIIKLNINQDAYREKNICYTESNLGHLNLEQTQQDCPLDVHIFIPLLLDLMCSPHRND
ncbi:hypothetical protein CDAR_581331 [Caerostris darwini]|uniref:Uncharacterized protein n=1 Tax=Caerostris darwini TaxID=1538125 RepID=A0AAV4PPR3_9ARAC|nr:hypothetical protein CDAR_581331 [Caerostris darwini]